MPTILIWMPNSQNIGHVALRVNENLYISLWPDKTYGPVHYITNIKVASHGSTYEEDCEAEGEQDNPRPPDEDIDIDEKLNENEIENWWNRYKTLGFSISNCCISAVKIALRIGGLSEDTSNMIYNQLDEIQNHFISTAKSNKLSVKRKKKQVLDSCALM